MNYRLLFWKKKRKAILKRDNVLCQEHARYGISETANTVHHCIPCDVVPQLRYTDENLISLCASCHNKMHVRQTQKLSDLGKSWERKANRLLQKK